MSLIVGLVISGAALAGVVVIAPAVKQALDMAPFLYANTRCSARTGALITPTTYSELSSSSSVKEMYGVLEDSAYSSIVEHAKDFVSFSTALDKNLYDDYKWLFGIVPKDLQPIIKALTLRFEINDIKSVMNALKHGTTVPELHHIANDELRFKLQSVSDFPSFVSSFEDTPYSDVFATGSLDNLELLNTSLDRLYLQKVLSVIGQAPKKNSAAFLEYWRHIIDLFNIRLAFRRMASGNEELEFIKGGMLDIKALSAITNKTQLEGVLRDSSYGEQLTDITPLSVENAFSRSLRKLASLLSSRYPLEAGYVVRYIILKELELKNINLISKLKEENFAEEEIKKLLVVQS